jgi:hypothetical protein
VTPATAAGSAASDGCPPARRAAGERREALDRTLAHYDGRWSSADRERAVFYARCALLEDLAHGLGPGPRRYADAALAHLPHTFADPAA